MLHAFALRSGVARGATIASATAAAPPAALAARFAILTLTLTLTLAWAVVLAILLMMRRLDFAILRSLSFGRFGGRGCLLLIFRPFAAIAIAPASATAAATAPAAFTIFARPFRAVEGLGF